MGRTQCILKLFSFKATAFWFGLVWFSAGPLPSYQLHRTSHHIHRRMEREGGNRNQLSTNAKPGRVLLSPQARDFPSQPRPAAPWAS